MRYRVMFSCESAMFSWESAGLSGPPREAAPAEPRETAQCTSWRRTRGPGLATHIVFHRADAGPRRKHAGKPAATWTGPAENRLAPAIRATFQASVFFRAVGKWRCSPGLGTAACNSGRSDLSGAPKEARAAPGDPRAPRPREGCQGTEKTRRFRAKRWHFSDSVENSTDPDRQRHDKTRHFRETGRHFLDSVENSGGK